jgi:hypothetical protein
MAGAHGIVFAHESLFCPNGLPELSLGQTFFLAKLSQKMKQDLSFALLTERPLGRRRHRGPA